MAQRLWRVLLLAVLASLAAAGQYVETRTIQGTVTDQAGRPVEGAVVKLKNTQTLQIRSYITGNDGKFSFHGLNSRVDYRVTAESDGRSDEQTVSKFNSRPEVTVNLKLH
jgi:hypothetical protein